MGRLLGLLPPDAAVALGRDPVVDAAHEPAARPGAAVAGLPPPRAAELEALGGAADAAMVAPLEAAAPGSEGGAVGPPGPGAVQLGQQLGAAGVAGLSLPLALGHVEARGLADGGAGGGRGVGVELDGRLGRLLPLDGAEVLVGLLLATVVGRDVADVFREVVPSVAGRDEVGGEELVVEVFDPHGCLGCRVSM